MGKLKNSASIYLKFGSKLKIPVNPEEIEIKYPSNNKEYEVLGVGEIVVPRRPGLREISWESFFPGVLTAPYVNSEAKSPETYIKRLEKAMKNKMTGRLIISRSDLYDTNMRCIISNFETKDKGGEPDDMYYSITLLEYRDYSPRTVSIVTTPAATESVSQVDAVAESQREIETPVLRVGATVMVNGEYCYDSYGGKPHGTANSINTTVTRIVEGNPYPVHVGSYGWVQESQLQITG